MKNTKSAGVILIGNELLSGSIQDANLPHLAKQLESHGIRIHETRIILDIEQEIVKSVNELRIRYDYVFTTGGIGPTHDDITCESIAAAFGVELEIQQSVWDLLEQRLSAKGIEFNEIAQRMAKAPKGAKTIDCGTGTIPCYQMDNVFVLAGVPRIMRAMVQCILPELDTGNKIISGKVHASVTEVEMALALYEIQLQYPSVDIGSYPQEKDSPYSKYPVVFIVRGTEREVIANVCDAIATAARNMQKQAEVDF